MAKREVSPTLLADAEWVVLQPHSLRAMLYLLLALEVAGEPQPTRECAFDRCRKPMTEFHGNRDYCNDKCKGRAAHYRRKNKAGGGG